MKHWSKQQKIFGVLVVLSLCELLFSWGRATIDAIDFSADQVDHVRLYCAQMSFDEAAEVRDPEEIQALIDSVNALQNFGFDLKGLVQFGWGMGGSKLHEYSFFMKNGGLFFHHLFLQ